MPFLCTKDDSAVERQTFEQMQGLFMHARVLRVIPCEPHAMQSLPICFPSQPPLIHRHHPMPASPKGHGAHVIEVKPCNTAAVAILSSASSVS